MMSRPQLMRVIELTHYGKNGEVLYRDKNLTNIFHTSGEEFILKAIFTGETAVPSSYYFGLDDRVSLSADDTMSTIQTEGDEPATNGYVRQAVASTGEFSVTLIDGVNQAQGPIISFVAVDGDWGPVSNLFLSTKSDNTGYLLASIPLAQTVTISDGETISMRMGLSLRDCPL